MTIARLKELLNKFPDDLEIYIRNSNNICGTIAELENVEYTNAYCFGEPYRCIVLNTGCTSKELEQDEDGYYIDYEENDD